MFTKSSNGIKSLAVVAVAATLTLSSFAAPQTAEAGSLSKALGIGLAVGAGALIVNEVHQQHKKSVYHKRRHRHDGYSHSHKFTHYDHSHNTTTHYKPSNNSWARTETKRVQHALNDWGFNAGYADGVAGPKTRRAIRDFQSYIGAKRTGHLTASQKNILFNG